MRLSEDERYTGYVGPREAKHDEVYFRPNPHPHRHRAEGE